MFCSISLPAVGGILLTAIVVGSLTYRRTHNVGIAILSAFGALILCVAILAAIIFMRSGVRR